MVDEVAGGRERIGANLDVAVARFPERMQRVTAVGAGDEGEIPELHDRLHRDSNQPHPEITPRVQHEDHTGDRGRDQHVDAEGAEQHRRDHPCTPETDSPSRVREGHEHNRERSDDAAVDDVGLEVAGQRHGGRRDNDERRERARDAPPVRQRAQEPEDHRGRERPGDEHRQDEQAGLVAHQPAERREQRSETWVLDARPQPLTRARHGDGRGRPRVVVVEPVVRKGAEAQAAGRDHQRDRDQQVRDRPIGCRRPRGFGGRRDRGTHARVPRRVVGLTAHRRESSPVRPRRSVRRHGRPGVQRGRVQM
jgi:hypothetical protein